MRKQKILKERKQKDFFILWLAIATVMEIYALFNASQLSEIFIAILLYVIFVGVWWEIYKIAFKERKD